MTTWIAHERGKSHIRTTHRFTGRLASAFLIAATALTLAAGTTQALASEAQAASPGVGTVRPSWMVNPTNAALLYQRAWAIIGTEDEKLLGDPALKLEKGAVPAEDFADRLKNAQGYIGMIANASRLPAADWGVEYDKGFTALIPHLGQLRRSARIVIADSRRLFAAGQTQDGVERLATVLRMSRHTGGGLLISSLVGVALTRSALDEIDAALAGNRIDAVGAGTLLEALKPLTGEDPFAFRMALEGEAWVVIGSMREQYAGKGKDAGRIFIESMGNFGGLKPESELWKTIAAMDGEAIAKDLETASRYYAVVIDSWSMPDAQTRLREAHNDMDNGKYGILLKVLTAFFGKAHENATSITKPIADAKAKLEALAK
jgi:hypothetical protein